MGAGQRASAEMFARATEAIGEVQQAMEPIVREQVMEQAQRDIAEGRERRVLPTTAIGQEYNQVMRQASAARVSTQMERAQAELAELHRTDPDGFEAALTALRDETVANAPADIVGAVAQSFDREANRRAMQIRERRAALDLNNANQALQVRARDLTETIVSDVVEEGLESLQSIAGQQRLAELRDVFLARTANPEFGYSEELAEREFGLARRQIVAAAYAGDALGVLRAEGYTAALEYLERILTDETFGLSDQDRAAAFELARARVGQEQGLTQARRDYERTERRIAEQDMAERIDRAIGALSFTGREPDLDINEVREVLGDGAAVEYLRRYNEAREFYNEVGNLDGLPDAEAAARLGAWQARRGTPGLDRPITSDTDFNALAAAVEWVETRGRPAQVSEAGAVGAMQLLPDTARAMAQRLGVPFDRERLLNDPEYNRTLGREYLRTLMSRYGGDGQLAVTAYHAGPGLVDAWLRPRGTTTTVRVNGRDLQVAGRGDPRDGNITFDAWLSEIEARNPRSAAYPRLVRQALSQGRNQAVFERYEESRARRRTDPASTVQGQGNPDVFAAAQAFQAAPMEGTGYAYVDANLRAQDRAGISSGARRPLPNEVAMPYARRMREAMERGDTVLYEALATQIMVQFARPGSPANRGGHGQRVLQQVIELAGATEFSARVSADLAGAGQGGQPVTQAQAREADAAARTQGIADGSNGRAGAPVRVTTAEEAARLPPGTRFITPDGRVMIRE